MADPPPRSWTNVAGKTATSPRPDRPSRGGGRGGGRTSRPSDPATEDLKAAVAAATVGTGEIAAAIKKRAASLRGPSFAAVLKECGRTGAQEKGKEVFAGMVAAGVKPNVYTWGALVGCLAASGRTMADAEAAFADMQAAARDDPDVTPNTVVWSALISAANAGGDPARALRHFDAMRAAGVPADHITYAAALAAADRARDPDAALRLLDGMHASGAAAPADTYIKTVDALGAAGRWSDAVELFITAQLAGADATRGLVVALASALAAGGAPAGRSAALLFDAVRASRRGDAAMQAAALDAVAATCDWPVVARAWARAKAADVKPTAEGAAALVAAAKKGGGDVGALETELAALQAS